LKKAAPLLINVSFLIGFFWLLFAIIGVQGFKSSFKRQCVWIDPTNQQNYTNPFTLCGGHLNNITGAPQPWVYEDGSNGSTSSKGYLCPRGSQCIENISLYNGTVSFDNIMNSLELVFVIMSANTFTDLMYYTTNSDYMAAALFFAGGIVIMMLWLTNLLIAVITSSFQVIREEGKSSAFTTDEHHVQLLGQSDALRRTGVLKRWYDKTEWIWIVVIAYSLLCQALRSASMSQQRADFIWYSELVVTILLLMEIILRFAADWRAFHRRKRNLVDTFLAVITTVILLPPIQNSRQPYAWLTIFQIVRIYRVVWGVPMTRELIEKVLGNAAGIGNLVLFVFVITFLVAILAAQLFRGGIPQYDSNNNIVKVTFFTIWNSFLGMYQILSSENWTVILYTVTQNNDRLNTAWIGAIFFIGWFILSYFILINMFIAVIQENFDVSEDEKRLQQVKAFLQRKELGAASSNLALSTIFRFGRTRKTKDPLDYGQAAMEMLLKDAVVRDFLDEEFDPHQQNASIDPLPLNNGAAATPTGGGLSAIWNNFLTRVWNREPNPFYSSLQFSSGKEAFDPRAMAREAVSASMQRKKAQRDFLQRHPMYNTVLFIFKPDNPIRRLCQKIVGPSRGSERFEGVEPNKVVWYTFSAFIYAAIVTMVVLACVTTPLYQKEYFQTHTFDVKNWFVWTDMTFAAIFTLEALIKVIADGCFWTPNAYFRSMWGFIDGLVLVTLWINVITSIMNDGAVSRAVGAFKALRALRLLNVSDSARETFNSVILVGGWRVISVRSSVPCL
jgi:voltage-dependent calcium channel